MLSIRKPTPETLDRFLHSQRSQKFTYTDLGATSGTPPAGFVVDRTRIHLGSGEVAFTKACDAFRRWEQFRLGWVEPWSTETPIAAGETVAVMGHSMGLWFTNACRILSVVDTSGPVSMFGFTYGTLPAHVESGEERFLIEWHHDTNLVWYDILAFSRPNHFLAKIGYPVVRRLQRRFAVDSATVMFRAVDQTSPIPKIGQTSSDRVSH
jgi:uncharacterized protein (UPF0548 family)